MAQGTIKPNNHWHVSRSVPITALLALAIHTAAFVWGVAKLDSRVGNIEEWIKANADTQIKLERMTISVQAMDRRLEKIERYVDSAR